MSIEQIRKLTHQNRKQLAHGKSPTVMEQDDCTAGFKLPYCSTHSSPPHFKATTCPRERRKVEAGDLRMLSTLSILFGVPIK